MTAAGASTNGLRIKGATANISAEHFSVWTNLPLSQPASSPSTVNFWEGDKAEPSNMTPDGALLWRVLNRLLGTMDILGVTYGGGLEPRHLTLRVTPGSNMAPTGIAPGIKDVARERTLLPRYRFLQGIDMLADGVCNMAGMTSAPPLAPKHDDYVRLEPNKIVFEWTAGGEVAVKVVVRDIISGLNLALDALHGGNA